MIQIAIQKIARFGFKHELSKRYTWFDWIKSIRVSKLIESNLADQIVSEFITAGDAGLIGRLGGTEARFLGEYFKLKRLERIGIPIWLSSKFSPRWKKRVRDVHLGPGFYFDNWQEVERFASEYCNALSESDVLGAWGVAFTWVEGRNLNPKKTRVIPVGFTAPWVEPYSLTNTPWSQSLEGKKVLVVSGFADSIKSQHSHLSKAFKSIKYPSFELHVVKAPIVAGDRDSDGRSWFELLEDMKSNISKADFDIALIAAGAFSYPLAAYVKSIGKIGIHCGGGLQLFFAIMGNRWNNSPEILKYVNEFWVRPSKSETPRRAGEIENSCYW